MLLKIPRFAPRLAAFGVCVFGALAGVAGAQTYPTRTVRIVDVFAAGGSTDMVARIVAAKLTPALNQPVIVENRPGAGGKVGTEYVTKATPDGHTLFLGLSIPLAANAALYKLPYDTLADLGSVARVATGAYVLVSHPSLPARSVPELVQLAKGRPGELNYSSSGSGSGGHLVGELLKSRGGINLVHVAYNGVVPALTAVMTGEVSVSLITVASAAEQIRSGRLKALGVTSPQRSRIIPDVPTVAESGLAGFDVVATYGVYGPAGIRSDIVGRLNTELRRIVADEDVRKRFATLGIEPSSSSPEELASGLRSELSKWAKVIQVAGIRVE
jgi:tripartite-type tricarboxylate transporter receptor subunit TctC